MKISWWGQTFCTAAAENRFSSGLAAAVVGVAAPFHFGFGNLLIFISCLDQLYFFFQPLIFPSVISNRLYMHTFGLGAAVGWE